jgi:hypothetical protein
MFLLSFRLALASHFTITFALIVQSYPSIFLSTGNMLQSHISIVLLLSVASFFFKLLLYRCPPHPPREYMFHGLFTDVHLTISPFQVKGVRVDMPRPIHCHLLRTRPWPARGREYIIFTFCHIRDKET